MKRVFDPDKFSITVLTPAPIDISAGITGRIAIDKVNKDLIKTKTGLNGEVLISEQYDDMHYLTIAFLPTAPAIYVLDILKKIKTQFGVLVSNNSSPKYKGVASESRIINKPDSKIGDSGFEDLTYKILMSDYNEIFIGENL